VARFRFTFWPGLCGTLGLACLASLVAESEQPTFKPASAAPAASPAASSATNPAAASPGRAALAAAPAGAQAPQTGIPLPPEQAVTHVTHTIAWYRSIVGLQQLPVDSEDVVQRDRLVQTALTALQLAFDFGHAAARLASEPAKANPPSGTSNGPADSPGQAGELDQAAARLADRVSTLQAQLSSLDEQIAHASAADKATLSAKRGEVAAALALTREMQATVEQIERFEEASDARTSGASGGLAAQIADLQKGVPELRQAISRTRGGAVCPGSGGGAGGVTDGSSAGATSPGATPPGTVAPAPATVAAAGQIFRPESAGVIALIAKWFSLEGVRRQLSAATKQTDALVKELEGVRGAVTQGARALANQNLDFTSTDPAQLAQAKQQFEAASSRFKQLATLLIPVGEEAITVESARSILSEWRDSLAARNAIVVRYLALHLGFLLGSIAVVLLISEVWRRATFRYLHDSRRRQQFLALRRVVVGVALTAAIVFGLVSEVGSLATYAGLITAGLAVALQNVILAVVGYFFLIGRYGVRVGDRITLAGVTGRVVEIGLVRIYLMELTGPEMRPSGRMVVLSNAVLFQPTALFKQMPGGGYFWHTISLTLAPTTDVSAAEKRLSEAADSVYANYRPAIEQQHAALQQFIEFETAMPKPEVYVRLTDKGLECSVRYPVEPARAAIIDQKMLTALREAQAKPPPLEVVGGPLLMTSDN
jgi:small-conductance mechanosensitive channel